MKRLIQNYTFNPSARTITFTDYDSINLEGILLITNVTRNTIIYNFANPQLGGGVSANTLTLNYNTSSMNSNDELQIFYDDGSLPATETTLMSVKNALQSVPDYDEAGFSYTGSNLISIVYKKNNNVINTITFEYNSSSQIQRIIKS